MEGQRKPPDRATNVLQGNPHVNEKLGYTLHDKAFDLLLGRNFRALRRKSGVGVGALSKVLQVSTQQIQKYESGQNRFPLSKLLVAMQHLGIPVDVFLQSLALNGKGTQSNPTLHSLHPECGGCPERKDPFYQKDQEHYAALTKLADDIEQLAKQARNMVNGYNHHPKNQP